MVRLLVKDSATGRYHLLIVPPAFIGECIEAGELHGCEVFRVTDGNRTPMLYSVTLFI